MASCDLLVCTMRIIACDNLFSATTQFNKMNTKIAMHLFQIGFILKVKKTQCMSCIKLTMDVRWTQYAVMQSAISAAATEYVLVSSEWTKMLSFWRHVYFIILFIHACRTAYVHITLAYSIHCWLNLSVCILLRFSLYNMSVTMPMVNDASNQLSSKKIFSFYLENNRSSICLCMKFLKRNCQFSFWSITIAGGLKYLQFSPKFID